LRNRKRKNAMSDIKTRKDEVDGTQGGMLEGDSHDEPSGGIDTLVVDSGQKLLVEGGEYVVKKPAMADEDDTHKFDGKEMTNREIIEEINNKEYMRNGGYIRDWGNKYLNLIFGCSSGWKMEDGGEVNRGMLGTKEFYDVMADFERYAKGEIRTGSMGLAKEPKENWEKRSYYSDGVANEAFKIFLGGYSLGKVS